MVMHGAVADVSNLMPALLPLPENAEELHRVAAGAVGARESDLPRRRRNRDARASDG
jgi:hypothetical protein